MTFIWPWMLLTLLLVPLLIWLYLRLLRKQRRAAANFGALGVFQTSSGRKLGRRRHIPTILFLVGLALLMFSLARPEMLVALPRVEGTVILAFDVSNSMGAEDLEPTRLEAAKEAARIFVENQPRTILIGVVAFSNGGLVVQQPTNDQGAVLSAIERISPQGGTSLGQGIFTSLNAIAGEAIAIDENAFTENELGDNLPTIEIADYSSAVIMLLTDGENTGPPEPLEIAQVAAEAGVRIYPVGIGSEDGIILEIDGFNVLTQLDETVLKEIAGTTNGYYYHAEDEESLKEIYENVDLQLAIKGQKMEVTAIIVGISLLFFLIGGGLSLLWFGRMP